MTLSHFQDHALLHSVWEQDYFTQSCAWMLIQKHMSMDVIKMKGSTNYIKKVYYSTVSVDIED